MTKTEKLLLKELKVARTAINKMKAECNQFDEGFTIGKAALKRIKGVLKDFKPPVAQGAPTYAPASRAGAR